MKKINLLVLNLFFALNLIAQNVIIPDANFKAVLVANPAINTNGDGEIQVSEASVFTGTIDVMSNNIFDLTGIEAFPAIVGLDCSFNQLTVLNISSNTALDTLNCQVNRLTSLDVSPNATLVYLNCGTNALTSLDVSANSALIYLDCHINGLANLNVSGATAIHSLHCGYNPLTNLDVSNATTLNFLDCPICQLTSLNVSGDTALKFLSCWDNHLTSLDVSANTALISLACFNNEIMSLDVSSNAALTSLWCHDNLLSSLNMKNGNNINFVPAYDYNPFDATHNPDLKCIQVDNAVYSNTHWASSKDATASYYQNCGVTNIPNPRNDIEIEIYPNPSSGIFTINLKNKTVESKICVYDVLGNCVLDKVSVKNSSQEIDLSGQPKGIYFMEIVSGGERAVKKIILE